MAKYRLLFLVFYFCATAVVDPPPVRAQEPSPPFMPTSINDCQIFLNQFMNYLSLLHTRSDACHAVADLKQLASTPCCTEWWGRNNPLRSGPASCSGFDELWCCATLKRDQLYRECVAKIRDKELKNKAEDLPDLTSREKAVRWITDQFTKKGLDTIRNPLAKKLAKQNIDLFKKMSDQNLKSLLQAFRDWDKKDSRYVNNSLNRIAVSYAMQQGKETFHERIEWVSERVAQEKRQSEEERKRAASPSQPPSSRPQPTQQAKQPVHSPCDDCDRFLEASWEMSCVELENVMPRMNKLCGNCPSWKPCVMNAAGGYWHPAMCTNVCR